jgi:hypothetical protein
MDRVALERLMLDRALGAMEADVEALLGAYLEGRGEEQSEGEIWRQVVRKVRRVVGIGEADAVLPEFSGVRNRQWWDGARNVGKLAACLVLGAGLAAGWFTWRDGKVGGGERGTVIARSETPPAREFSPKQRVIETAGAEHRESRGVVWVSPVRAPVVRG